ncbi:MAG: hypothetical protein KAG14_04710 [Mycoplasmataceae bacterium]|nr:hypothetical protein [Mycoplasmataceae bacterium]
MILDIPNTHTTFEKTAWSRLLDILRSLRSEQGCPWDKEQTTASLRPHIIEEVTEVLEAMGNVLNNPSEEHHAHLQEEFGDVLLVLTMMMVNYEAETKKDTLGNIIDALNEKLIRRHPHVFGDAKIDTREQLHKQWNQIKTTQEGKKSVSLDEYKNYMSILERTKEVQKRLEKDHGQLTEHISEKTTTLADMIQSLADLEKDLPPKDGYRPSPDHIEKAVGEAMFSLIDITRTLKINPTAALSRKLAFEIQNAQSKE